MKIPKIFTPENKNLEKKLKELESGKPFEIKQVKDILSLSCVPEEINNYALRTDFEIINQDRWVWNFGEDIPKYIIQAGEMTYMQPKSLVFTAIYLLEFKKGTDLSRLNREINLEKEISFLGADAIKIKCLKKDNYLVAIKANHTDKQSLDIFGNWYLKNFKLEEL